MEPNQQSKLQCALPNSVAADIQALLVTPVIAGRIIGQADQTTRNQLANPERHGEFLLPIVLIGKFKRKMVRVKDIETFVSGLEPISKPTKRGAPTKVERISKTGRPS
jgi:hypothetical protein